MFLLFKTNDMLFSKAIEYNIKLFDEKNNIEIERNE